MVGRAKEGRGDRGGRRKGGGGDRGHMKRKPLNN